MTDKQTIIDGGDVSKCKHHRKCILPDNIGCKIDDFLCCDKPNCYFKQLAHKTQECKKLNNKIIDMNSIIEDAAINLGNKDFTLYDLPFEIKKLRQECEQKEKELLSNEKIINKLMKEVDELKQECEKLKNQVDEDYNYYTTELKTLRDIISNRNTR